MLLYLVFTTIDFVCYCDISDFNRPLVIILITGTIEVLKDKLLKGQIDHFNENMKTTSSSNQILNSYIRFHRLPPSFLKSKRLMYLESISYFFFLKIINSKIFIYLLKKLKIKLEFKNNFKIVWIKNCFE